MSASPILETSALTKRFGGVIANDNVDFRLAERELRCLIGPNGAGKSTFFKMLTGQLTPSSGLIRFRGQNIDNLSSFQIARQGIGIKTQVPNVFDGLTVREHFWLASRRHVARDRDADRQADEILQTVRLEHIADGIVGTLSHGQRQWVEIGTVIAANPDLILLDEPAAGMTDEETVRTAEIIRDINQVKAIVVVEHDMEFIKLIAQQVTVFHQGRIMMEDDIHTVLADARVRDVYLGKKVVL